MMGELSGIQPPRMDWSSPELPTAFQEFRQYCDLVLTGPLKDKTDAEKANYILIWIGQEGLKIFNSWNTEAKDPKTLWKKFETYLEPTSNFRLHRFQMQQIRQGPGESVDEFILRCKTMAKKCKFSAPETNERLIEQLIVGTNHKKIQEVLLSKDDKLTLEEALTIARTREATDAHMKQFEAFGASNTSATVHSVSKPHKLSKCGNCGETHATEPRDACPAFGSRCGFCHRYNHWQIVCRSALNTGYGNRRPRSRSRGRGRGRGRGRSQRRGRSPSPHQRNIHEVSDQGATSLGESFERLSFASVDVTNDTRDEVYASINVTLDRKPDTPATLQVKVDTGAQGNLLPLRIFRRMYPEKLDSEGFPKSGSTTVCHTKLTAYNGSRILQYGVIKVPSKFHDTSHMAEFYVTDSNGPAILGLPSSRALKLVTLNCAIQQSKINSKEDLRRLYPDRFEGIGHFKGKFHITVDPSVPPVVHAPRRCPIHIKDELKQELDSMVKANVIAKVSDPTDWVNSLAFSRKANGKLRVCLDPKDLNRAIKRPHYRTPTLDEITHKFSGATVFSKLDARHGYWSVELDEESSVLTTFNSPFGRFCFKRLPFGLNLSQDVFQERMDHILERCQGAVGIADDVAVVGRDQAEHDRNLLQVLSVAREEGLIFNYDKCEINRPSIKFFGMLYDADGVHPDPDKVKAIQEMDTPQSAKQLQEFLGMVTYLSPFLPHVSQLTAPLRELFKKDVVFDWTPSHQVAYNKIISLISREVSLSYFDPQKPSVLQVDASSRGLGAVLMQANKPIAFASKSLSECEQRYANIERELLAVVFGCEKFHTYLYGKRFLVESDHKPLEMIHLKNISSAPQRLQRMLLRIQQYDLQIAYKPGKEVAMADALSRSPVSESTTIDLDVQVHLVQFSEQKQDELREATRSDSELQALNSVILAGWPERQSELPPMLRQYWSYRDELSIQNGIIVKGERVVIPTSMQSYILGKLHESHLGIEKTKMRARTCVFWRNCNSDIENMIKSCHICQKSQKKQSSEPLLQHSVPTRPWQIIGSDIFYLDGFEYIIYCDYYSKFPIVRKIHGKSTADTVVNITKQLFAEQGIPETLMSDNGPQYASYAFKKFSADWDFRHVTSSPHYPQSNGFIERQIQTVKRTLTRSKSAGTDPDMALLILRSTPLDCHLASPAELLNARKFKSNLPVKINNTSPNRDDIADRLSERQDLQKSYHDQTACKELPPLVPGQSVRIRDEVSKQWEPAIVSSKLDTPRSYQVQTSTGSLLRRNRRSLRETGETFSSSSQVELGLSSSDTQIPTKALHHSTPKRVHFQPVRPPETSGNTAYHTKSGRAVNPPKKLCL